jgi:hypothetical protein
MGESELARETGVLGENPPPVSLRPPQIPHDLTWTRNHAAAVRSNVIN